MKHRGFCVILEIDSAWLVKFDFSKYAIHLALGFVAITIWRLPYTLVMKLYNEDAINKYFVESDINNP